jgi:hypothetical protein
MDSHDAEIARTGFFVLSSVFKERPRSRKAQWPELDTLFGSASDQVTLTLCFARAYPCAVHSGRSSERSASVAEPVVEVKPQFPGPAAVEQAPPYRQGTTKSFLRRIKPGGLLPAQGNGLPIYRSPQLESSPNCWSRSGRSDPPAPEPAAGDKLLRWLRSGRCDPPASASADIRDRF